MIGAWRSLIESSTQGLKTAALLLCLIASSTDSFAQGVTGFSSLIMAPTAEMPGDGVARLSLGYVDEKYSTLLQGRNNYLPYGASIGFLPFLEVGFRFNRQLDVRNDALGDRMLMVRVRVVGESARLPAVVLGVHDFLKSTEGRTRKFNAMYVVASKQFDTESWIPEFSVHAGYGTDMIDARGHQFVGLFGGIAVEPYPFLRVMMEYDGETVNAGPQVRLLGSLYLLAALQNFDTLTGGVTVQVAL